MGSQWVQTLRESLPRVRGAEEVITAASACRWEGPPAEWLSDVVRLARQQGVWRVYVDATAGGGVLRLRFDGVVVPVRPLSAEEHRGLLAALQEAAPELGRGTAAVRVEFLQTRQGLQATVAAPPRAEPRAPWLDWSEPCREAAERMQAHPCGLVVFCHRGWSTQFGLMGRWLEAIAHDHGRYVLLSDGPIFASLREAVRLVEVDGSAEAWERGLRQAVAHDFDVVAIAGRDERLAARHAVLTALDDQYTLVSVSSRGVLDALLWLAAQPPLDPALLSQVLVGVVSEYTARRVCPNCARPCAPDDVERPIRGRPGESLTVVLASANALPLPPGQWVRGEGCERCHHTGYVPPSQGGLVLAEALHVDSAFADLLARQPGREELQAALAARGFRTLSDHALEAARTGETTVEEAVRVGLARRANL